MRRPLLYGCIILFIILAQLTQWMNPPPWNACNTGWEGEEVSLLGQVCKKEYRVNNGEEKIIIYLDSVYYSEEEDFSSLQVNDYSKKLSEINPFNKVICELNISALPAGDFVPVLGNKVIVQGKWQNFQGATNPGEFDAAHYYAIEGIGGRLQDTVLLAADESCWKIRECLFKLRQHWLRNLYQAMPQKEASVLAKMLLGDGSGLDKELRNLYQSNGIVHILSISGLHISLLGMGLYKLLRRITLPLIPAAILGGILIFSYGLMTGFGISACRAVGMYLIHMLGEITGRTYDMLTAMGVLAMTLLLDNPLLAYHSGFLLSFTSVCGVGMLTPLLQFPQEWFQKKPGQNAVIFFFKKLLEKGASGFSASLGVTLFTLPIQLFFFFKIPVYSVFVNLCVIPFMSIVMVVGLLIMMFPGFSFLCPIEVGIFSWFEWLCRSFEQLPGHTLVVGRPEIGKIIVYYLILMVILLLGRRMKHYISISGVMGLVLFLLLPRTHGMEIYMLDVGQGDCICVRTEDNQCFLFDGGSSSRQKVGEKVIRPFLEYQGIRKIHGVFLSHEDADHYSGILELLEEEKIPIDNVFLPNIAALDTFCEKLQQNSNVTIQRVQRGDRWQVGEVSLLCLHPPKTYQSEDNAQSACYLLRYGDFSMLFTGDVEGEGEALLLEELKRCGLGQVTVLKVAHHGSKYSTTEAFLKQLQPSVALISCGRKNSYGHPHPETLERLEDVGSEILTTPEYGAITVEVGEEVEIFGFIR